MTESTPPPADSHVQSPPELRQHLAFLNLSEADRIRLRDLAGPLTATIHDFTEGFYRHLFNFHETAIFLRDPSLVARLKAAQEQHLASMLEAHWDADYLARRRSVGKVHAQAGINPHMFLGAYNQYLQYALNRIPCPSTGDAATQSQAARDQLGSLFKVVLLDIGLTLDAYFLQSTRNMQEALELVFQANTELRQFAQFTSHDLKTPLATAANLCEEVVDEFGREMPDTARELIQSAHQRLLRLATTIDELLRSTVSLQNGGAAAHFSSHELVAEVLEQLDAVFRSREIAVHLAPDLPQIVGDRARLREVFFNLLANAAKFMDKQPGLVAVDAEDLGDEIRFTVADNGPGIPHEDLTRIFSPFCRAKGQTDQPGSGLGLYFSKCIVEQHGGRLWAESSLGEGSRFHLLLTRNSRPGRSVPFSSGTH